MQEEAALCLQRAFRGKQSYVQRRNAALVLQRWWRNSRRAKKPKRRRGKAQKKGEGVTVWILDLGAVSGLIQVSFQ